MIVLGDTGFHAKEGDPPNPDYSRRSGTTRLDSAKV
jgi:hypothetical protein